MTITRLTTIPGVIRIRRVLDRVANPLGMFAWRSPAKGWDEPRDAALPCPLCGGGTREVRAPAGSVGRLVQVERTIGATVVGQFAVSDRELLYSNCADCHADFSSLVEERS